MRSESLLKRTEGIVETLGKADFLPPLLVRLFVGYLFFETGWGKVHNLSRMTGQFREWGLPLPGLTATVSSYTELLGGALLVIGLCTRLAAIPLLINMLVAIATVKIKQVGTLSDFVEIDEPLYALSFLWLLIAGPGRVSLDHFIFELWKRRSEPRPRAPASAGPHARHERVATHVGAGQ